MAITGTVKFRPLGGLGEIGMNCFALEQAGEILVVDCGATFPDDDLGVDLIVPDFSWLIRRQADIAGVFITHGHEDHIGAVPHLLRALERPVPFYAPEHAAALIAARLSERDLDTDCLHVVHPRNTYAVGSFKVEPIHVAHSIIGATSLSIETEAGIVLHTADFDLDDEQPAGSLTDEARFRELGEAGVRLLLSDSTNIDSPARPLSEGDVGRRLAELVAASPHRVVVGMFSSNAHRLLSLGNAAMASGRKLCLLGRSLSRQQQIADRLGVFGFPSDLMVAPEALRDLPRHECLVIAGGSQGEGPSSLRRLSLGTHSHLQLEKDDAVILSSRVIPGNEKAVFTMLNDMTRLGARVVTRSSEPGVHTSGHASREELAKMLQWTKPRAFIPVHGTLHHLTRHRDLALEQGVCETLVVENGTAVEFDGAEGLRIGEAFPHGQVRIAWGGEEMSSKVRRRRGELARRGMVIISVVIDDHGESCSAPRVSVLGVPGVDDDEGALAVVVSTVRRAVARRGSERMVSLEDAIRRAVRSALRETCAVRPLVEVHVSVVDV